ncbi:unnamed protein product [Dracunculus medinensis]|uniref:Condensin complex subunit 1 C-terminal domain-containing protein n=1 Tax=Dracunculus medinensis TaxID=318479 RepID=A0A3P7SU96_DRAME|nr:unnamed protein product [Dracunculus medinensis]
MMMLVQFFLIGFEFLILLNIYFLFSFLRYINSFISHSGNLPEGSRRKARDKLLLRLQDHIVDINAIVRSRVLQLWTRLARNFQIPLAFINGGLIRDACSRLIDKSINVRKNAAIFLTAVLQYNPFGPSDALFFALEMEKCLSTILRSIASSQASELAEIIGFIVETNKFSIRNSENAVREFFRAIWRYDSAAKEIIIKAAADLFISANKNREICAKKTAENLIRIILNVPEEERISVEEVYFVRGTVADLSKCIIDSSINVANLSKFFFSELSKKVCYRLLWISKYKQADSLVEKLCQRLQSTTSQLVFIFFKLLYSYFKNRISDNKIFKFYKVL